MNKLTQDSNFNRLEHKTSKYRFNARDWSEWGLLFRFLIVICKLLDKEPVPIVPVKLKKSTRKKSAWNAFMSEKLMEGKTMKEVAELYKKSK